LSFARAPPASLHRDLNRGNACPRLRGEGLLRRSSRRRNGLPLSQSRLYVGFSQSTPALLLPASLALSSAPCGPWATSRPTQTRRPISQPPPPRCVPSIWGCPCSA